MNQKYDIDKSEAKTQAHKRLFFLNSPLRMKVVSRSVFFNFIWLAARLRNLRNPAEVEWRILIGVIFLSSIKSLATHKFTMTEFPRFMKLRTGGRLWMEQNKHSTIFPHRRWEIVFYSFVLIRPSSAQRHKYSVESLERISCSPTAPDQIHSMRSSPI